MDKSDKKYEQKQESELLRFLKDRGAPFVAPDGFFQEQYDQLMDQLEEDTSALNPSFGERQIEVFQIPEGYFERFLTQLLQKLPQEVKVVDFRQYLFPLAIAASIAILIAFGWKEIKSEPLDQLLVEEMAKFNHHEMLAILDQENIEVEVLLSLMPEGAIISNQSIIDPPIDADLDALFEELDHSDLESLLLE